MPTRLTTWITALLLLAMGGPAFAADKPNIVYLLADDLDWGDLGVNGGKIPTPRLDRLFKEGVRLDNFMGWCVYSPTRAMLLTGRHPYRVGTGPETGGEPAKQETTIAKAFKLCGYNTGIMSCSGTSRSGRSMQPIWASDCDPNRLERLVAEAIQQNARQGLSPWNLTCQTLPVPGSRRA
jgi:hypothetical protein